MKVLFFHIFIFMNINKIKKKEIREKTRGVPTKLPISLLRIVLYNQT